MNGRALTLAISLLCTAAAGAALVSVPGCGGCLGYDPWSDSEVLDLGTQADPHAVVRLEQDVDGRRYDHIAVGADGTVVVWGEAFVVAASTGLRRAHQPLAGALLCLDPILGADQRAISS